LSKLDDSVVRVEVEFLESRLLLEWDRWCAIETGDGDAPKYAAPFCA
jgi:hypothetical protein